MKRWTGPNQPSAAKRWQSRAEILTNHLAVLSPLELLRVRPELYAQTWGWDRENQRFASGRLALYEALERRAGFNPDQSRVPAGSPDGGQWTSDGARTGLIAYADVDGEVDASDPDGRVELVGSKMTIDYSEALTGISRIDDTTKNLIGTLATVVAALPDGSGPLYGMAVHRFFALAVRAQRLEGIGYFDVETTFSLRDGARYGSEDSIRTDVVLRNDAGEIIAIYDVKTGRRGITKERATELRAKTQTGPEVPIIGLTLGESEPSAKVTACRSLAACERDGFD